MSESREWVLLHAGALGDLVLAIHLLRRVVPPLTPVCVRSLARTSIGPIRSALFSLEDCLGAARDTTWLFVDDDSPPPNRLRDSLNQRRVLSFLGSVDAPHHRRLTRLKPRLTLCIEPRPNPQSPRHILDQWQLQLAQQGLLAPACLRAAQDGLDFASTPAGPVVLHPGSGGHAKCWPLESYLQLARALSNSGLSPKFVLGPAEIERWERQCIAQLRDEFPTTLCADIASLRTILGQARAYVGNDSGATHLAAFLGLQTLALFGPTDPMVWAPLGRRVQVLSGRPTLPGWGIQVDEIVRRLTTKGGLADGTPSKA